MEKPVFDINVLLKIVKRYFLKEELKYLSELHGVNKLAPEIQADLKRDIQRMLENVFEDTETDLRRIEESIELFRQDFEKTVEDTVYIWNNTSRSYNDD